MKYVSGIEIQEGDVVKVKLGQLTKVGVLKIIQPGTEDSEVWELPNGGIMIEEGNSILFTTAHVEQDEDIEFMHRKANFTQ